MPMMRCTARQSTRRRWWPMTIRRLWRGVITRAFRGRWGSLLCGGFELRGADGVDGEARVRGVYDPAEDPQAADGVSEAGGDARVKKRWTLAGADPLHTEVTKKNIAQLVAECEIDHTVAKSTTFRGGSGKGRDSFRSFSNTGCGVMRRSATSHRGTRRRT